MHGLGNRDLCTLPGANGNGGRSGGQDELPRSSSAGADGAGPSGKSDEEDRSRWGEQ